MRQLTDLAAIRGFNYQPGYGSTGLEIWRSFDAAAIAREIACGKAAFPGMNAVRFWLSWDAWQRDPPRFAADFATALAIFAGHGLMVMAVLFNRWHDQTLDYGGVYLDHVIPGSQLYRADLFDPYIAAIVGAHRDDARIFAWDLCNEPGWCGARAPALEPAIAHEYAWLARMRERCREVGASAPLTVGAAPTLDLVRHWEPLSDLITFHPYPLADWAPPERFEPFLDACVAFACERGKPILATECCWGSLDDLRRAEIVAYTLGQLKRRGLGWMAYLLHHSLIADAHRPAFGPLSAPGNLAFLEADGSLRPGHEVFNAY